MPAAVAVPTIFDTVQATTDSKLFSIDSPQASRAASASVALAASAPSTSMDAPLKRCAACGNGQLPSPAPFVPADPVKAAEEESRKAKKSNNDNGFYLNIILGKNIDLTMSSSDRFQYKKDYENFKLHVTGINLGLLVAAGLFPSRPIDAICTFMQVWYYCTLTIRESILMINGSKIHWWWVAHHYLACALAGVAVTWPEDDAYHEFRVQFGLFAVYICVVQQLQYQYQSGCLRRLRSLGSSDDMDITLEGFASWMFAGLTFLLPFLSIAYIFELYNAFTLFVMWQTQKCVWQVIALAVLFAVVGVGNIIMVVGIVIHKLKEDPKLRKMTIRSKYPSMPKMEDAKNE